MIYPQQATRHFLRAKRFGGGSEGAMIKEKETMDFVIRKLADVLQGTFVEESDPPDIDLVISDAVRKVNRSSF